MFRMRSSERPSTRMHSLQPLPNQRKGSSYETGGPVMELVRECGIERYVPRTDGEAHGMMDQETWCGRAADEVDTDDETIAKSRNDCFVSDSAFTPPDDDKAHT